MKEEKLTQQEKIDLIIELRHDKDTRHAFSHKIAKVIKEQMLYIFDVAENEGFDKKKEVKATISPFGDSVEEQLSELLDYVSGDFKNLEIEETEEVEEKIYRWNIFDIEDN